MTYPPHGASQRVKTTDLRIARSVFTPLAKIKPTPKLDLTKRRPLPHHTRIAHGRCFIPCEAPPSGLTITRPDLDHRPAVPFLFVHSHMMYGRAAAVKIRDDLTSGLAVELYDTPCRIDDLTCRGERFGRDPSSTTSLQ